MEYQIRQDNSFTIDDVDFLIDISAGSDRRKSQPNNFTIVKDRNFLTIYDDIAEKFSPKAILELGIFQGGSFVFLDKIFKPERIAALDIADQPVVPLVDYCRDRDGRAVHFQTSQTDTDALDRIIKEDLGGELDMVVDDASHDYELTRRSFELLFPKLAPGGLYIIEDWAWGHDGPYQREGGYWYDKPALTNLIFDIIVLQGSGLLIKDVRVTKFLTIVRKAENAHEVPADFLDTVKLRNRKMPLI